MKKPHLKSILAIQRNHLIRRPNIKRSKTKRFYRHAKTSYDLKKQPNVEESIKSINQIKKHQITTEVAKPQNTAASSATLDESSVVSSLLNDDDILPVTYNRDEYKEQKELEAEDNKPPTEIDRFDSAPYDFQTMGYRYKDGGKNSSFTVFVAQRDFLNSACSS